MRPVSDDDPSQGEVTHMNFGFSEEQHFLRESARKFLDERCPMREVRRLMAEPAGYSDDL